MRKLIALMMFLLACALCVGCSCEDEDITGTSSSGDCEHYWDNGKIIEPATQETSGEMTYRCLFCGAERTEHIPKLPHDHVYGEEWLTDRMNHWHACAVKNCTVKGSKGGHEWSEGEIIIEADQVTTGTKKYTCTVCSYSKEEEYRAKAQVTKEEFESAITQEAFSCVTYVATTTEVTLTVKIANGYVLYDGSVTEDSEENHYGSYNLAAILKGVDFDSLVYDKEVRVYIYKGERITMAMQFADGCLSVLNLTKDGKTVKYKFSAYDRTSFEIK